MKRYAQMKKIIEFFNSPKISRMGEYMLTGRYIMVLFALASVFVIFDISVAGVLTAHLAARRMIQGRYVKLYLHDELRHYLAGSKLR